MEKGMIAITFPDIKGAAQMLNTLNDATQGDITQANNVLIIEKDKQGNLKTIKSPSNAANDCACCELNFVVGLLLRGSVATDLLGEAAGTLLIHHINLGLDPEAIVLLTKDISAGSSVLFVQDCSRLNGTFETVFSQANGKLHDLSLSAPVIQEVQILSSTLNHYWN